MNNDKQVALIASAHPYKDNSHTWLVGIMHPSDAMNLLSRLRTITLVLDNHKNGFKHLSLNENAIKKLRDVHDRAIPCIKTCNCKQSIGGKCFMAWSKREHFEKECWPYVIDYDIIS